VTALLISFDSSPGDRPTLLCLPQAGAGAGQFRQWQQLLPDISVVGVQLPGREERWAEPPADSVDAVVDAVAAELGGRRLVIFGHSFGGLLGHEIAHRLTPAALVVAACRPPWMWVGAGHGLVADDVELHRLLEARGLDADDLDEDSREELFEVMRSDARLSLTYVLREREPLTCTVEAWGGDGDDTVSPQQLDGWAPYAGRQFVRRQFAGGHYFCQQRLKEILPILEGLIP